MIYFVSEEAWKKNFFVIIYTIEAMTEVKRKKLLNSWKCAWNVIIILYLRSNIPKKIIPQKVHLMYFTFYFHGVKRF